jgi:hypothetical protein
MRAYDEFMEACERASFFFEEGADNESEVFAAMERIRELFAVVSAESPSKELAKRMQNLEDEFYFYKSDADCLEYEDIKDLIMGCYS